MGLPRLPVQGSVAHGLSRNEVGGRHSGAGEAMGVPRDDRWGAEGRTKTGVMPDCQFPCNLHSVMGGGG